jgi:hypothetical protein
LRAAGETEATQDNLEDWLQLDGGDLGLGFWNCCCDGFLLNICIGATLLNSQFWGF